MLPRGVGAVVVMDRGDGARANVTDFLKVEATVLAAAADEMRFENISFLAFSKEEAMEWAELEARAGSCAFALGLVSASLTWRTPSSVNWLMWLLASSFKDFKTSKISLLVVFSSLASS